MKKSSIQYLADPRMALFCLSEPMIFDIKVFDGEGCLLQEHSFFSRKIAQRTVLEIEEQCLNYELAVRLPSSRALEILGQKVFD